ncbi:MAG: AMP-binding protein, partial [Myxococcota bacterium]|nr:AMP-binding protein [Myxococcota bacterium]
MTDSIVGLFEQTVERWGSRKAASYKRDGQWQSKSWRQLSDERLVVASALFSLGLKPHERVNIVSNTSYKWILADLGTQSVAGEPVAIYQSSLPHEVEYIVNDSQGVLVFVEDSEQLEKLAKCYEQLPNVRKVIVMDDDLRLRPGEYLNSIPNDWMMTWSEMIKLGKAKISEHKQDITQRISSLKKDDVLTLIYTSGTTGKPKGVVLTHANMMYECTSLAAIDGMIETNDVQLLFLPLAHVFAKVLECYWFTCGHEMAIDSDITQIVPNMSVVRPTVMCSVPRIFEKVYAKVAGAGTSAPGLAGKLFSWTLRLNERKALLANEGRQGDWWFQLQLNIAKSIIFSKIEKKLTALFGGRLRFFISGGAPLSKKMA